MVEKVAETVESIRQATVFLERDVDRKEPGVDSVDGYAVEVKPQCFVSGRFVVVHWTLLRAWVAARITVFGPYRQIGRQLLHTGETGDALSFGDHSCYGWRIGYSKLFESGYMSRNDLNCAEAMLSAADEHYGLNLGQTALKVACGFGGGLGRERACGALTGGMMALGCLFARDRSHRDPLMRSLREEYVGAFEAHFGSTECADIKKRHRDPQQGCEPVVLQAAVILERIIDNRRAE